MHATAQDTDFQPGRLKSLGIETAWQRPLLPKGRGDRRADIPITTTTVEWV